MKKGGRPMNQALVVIDIQNDITKHYKDIIHNLNTAIEWAEKCGMYIVYIKHNNMTSGKCIQSFINSIFIFLFKSLKFRSLFHCSFHSSLHCRTFIIFKLIHI